MTNTWKPCDLEIKAKTMMAEYRETKEFKASRQAILMAWDAQWCTVMSVDRIHELAEALNGVYTFEREVIQKELTAMSRAKLLRRNGKGYEINL